MSYVDFLNQFRGVIASFVDWLSAIADSLIHNYFFITLFGIALFISLFWLFFNFISNFLEKHISSIEEYNDRYNKYVEFKEIQSDYLEKHYEDEFDLKYRYKVLDLQVKSALYHNNKDLIVSNKIDNLEANIEAIKKLKDIHLNDDIPTNDNDVDMIIPNPPVNLSSFDELKRSQLQSLHKKLVEDNNSLIDDIISKNECINIDGFDFHTNGYSVNDDNFRPIDGKIVNIHTGEVACDVVVPLPTGINHFNSLTDEQKKEIEDFNDLESQKMKHNYGGKYGNFNEDMDSQLFS